MSLSFPKIHAHWYSPSSQKESKRNLKELCSTLERAGILFIISPPPPIRCLELEVGQQVLVDIKSKINQLESSIGFWSIDTGGDMPPEVQVVRSNLEKLRRMVTQPTFVSNLWEKTEESRIEALRDN